MRVQLSVIVAFAMSAVGLGTVWAQNQQPAAQASQTAPKTPQWKDRAEYDLVQSALAEKDPQKKLELLDQWKQKYAETDFKELRLEAYIETYQALKQPDKMLGAAKDLMNFNPKNLKGLYWVAVLSVPSQTSAEGLDLSQKAANGLINAEKPAGIDDQKWKETQTTMALVGHRTLGWVALQRKDYATGEAELKTELAGNDKDSEAAYWLASALRTQAADQNKPELFIQALFYYARSVAYDGPGALDPSRRATLKTWLQKAYTEFHGDDPQGFQALLALAKSSAVPPADFKILSSAEVANQKMQALQASDPSMALWVNLKQELTSATGEGYFNDKMKDAVVPPEGQQAFTGTVISQEPARAPKTVRVAVEDGKTADATLVFDPPLPRPADPGTKIQFRGAAKAFTAQPFGITFEVEKKNLTGWPAPPPPKKAVVHRKKKAD